MFIARFARHLEVNLRIKNALSDAGIASTLEPIGLDTSTGKRPDGSTVLFCLSPAAKKWPGKRRYHTRALPVTFPLPPLLLALLRPGRKVTKRESMNPSIIALTSGRSASKRSALSAPAHRRSQMRLRSGSTQEPVTLELVPSCTEKLPPQSKSATRPEFSRRIHALVRSGH